MTEAATLADVTMEARTGAAISDVIPDLAHLRITVFREWPYLYDGDAAYEERYLQVYTEAAGAIAVCAFHGNTLVGAATGCPMVSHDDDFSEALTGTSLRAQDTFYCAESVLLPDYRGHGVGHAFFDHREMQARALGLSHSAFCSVIRPEDHPLKPGTYRPLNGFWRKRGYAPLEGAIAKFEWQDLDQTVPTSHDLQFWSRDLTG